MARIPGIAVDHDEYEAYIMRGIEAPEVSHLRQRVINKATGLLEELYSWRLAWEEVYPQTCADAEPTAGDTDCRRPHLQSLHFDHIERALELVLYNTLKLTMLRGIRCISLFPQKPWMMVEQISRDPADAPLHAGLTSSPHAVAEELMRCIPYCLLPEHSALNAYYVVYALRVLRLFFLDSLPAGELFYATDNFEAGQNLEWVVNAGKTLAASRGFAWSDDVFEEIPDKTNAFRRSQLPKVGRPFGLTSRHVC